MEHERNYFDVFDLETTLDVDVKDLEKRYWKLQRDLHPDKYSGKTDEERKISADVSSYINEAYSTLKSRHARAVYYLQLHGVILGEMRTVSSPELLMEVMELREELEETNGHEDVLNLQTRLNQSLEDGYQSLKDAVVSQKNIDRATQIILRIQYLEKLLLEVDAKL